MYSFHPEQEEYSLDEVIEIVNRIVGITERSYELNAMVHDSDIHRCESRINYALDSMHAIQDYEEIPESIRYEIFDGSFEGIILTQLEDGIETALSKPDPLEQERVNY